MVKFVKRYSLDAYTKSWPHVPFFTLQAFYWLFYGREHCKSLHSMTSVCLWPAQIVRSSHCANYTRQDTSRINIVTPWKPRKIFAKIYGRTLNFVHRFDLVSINWRLRRGLTGPSTIIKCIQLEYVQGLRTRNWITWNIKINKGLA